jgi:class 3 adenylate cyclase/tetratricopeptide (TPR) repeat protein
MTVDTIGLVPNLLPYVPRLAVDWEHDAGDAAWQVVDGSLLFVDVSGFTKMSERLARHGKVGAEEVAEVIGSCFTELLAVAYERGGSLLKFGGDALLLMFTGAAHPLRAAGAGIGMQRRMAEVGKLETTAGRVTLRMSAGLHSGELGCFLVGASHRELMLAGPAITTTVSMEGAASAGQVIASPATAAALPASLLGEPLGPGVRVRRTAIPPLGPSVAEPLVRPAFDPAPFLPTSLRNDLVAGGGEAEHRQATVAFIHFDGTDELYAHEGPAAVAEALDELVTAVQLAADERDVTFLGTDVDHDGGKIILVAGAPRSVARDEDRLLAVLHGIATGPQRLKVRAGAHRGAVFAGNIGPFYRRTYTVMGDTVNLAARLMARAEPGQVITTPSVLDRSTTPWSTTALPPFMVKGKRAPIEAFVLGPPRRRVAAGASSLPLVGRDNELAVFDAQLEAVHAGEGRFVQIVGEAGIGKSRLTDELRRRAGADMPQVTITCDPYEASTPYAAFWWLLHDLLGVAPDAGPEQVVANLEERVREGAPELLPWLPLLATPLDIDLPDNPGTANLAPEFRRDRVGDVTATFIHLMMPTPVLVVVEDVHWMDSASQSVLLRIVEGLPTRPALVCATRRDEETGFEAPALDHVHTLRPEPLTKEQAAAALVAATEDSPLRPEEVATLAERAAGNPLFLAELLATANATGDVASLPDSVDAVITTQVDLLPPAYRRLLRHASVLGRSFSMNDLRAVADPDLPIADPATWRELESFVTFTAPGALAFRHALLRDTVYAGLPFRRRRELHARAGDAIAANLGDHADSEAELLSLHCYHAQRYSDAWRYARIAGMRAHGKYANAEAAELLERALAAARRVDEVPTTDVAQVWEILGDVRERAGFFDDALAAYRAARKLQAGNPAEEASLLVKEAVIAERTGHYRRVITTVRRGVRLLERDGSAAGKARAELKTWYAIVRQAQGRPEEAVSACLEAIEEAVAAQALSAEAHARFVLDWIHVERGRTDLAMHSARALEIYEEIGDLGGQAVVLNNLGAFAYWGGRWDEAIALYERGRDARLVTGNAVDAASGTMNIGEVFADQGHIDEAEACFRDAARVWRAAHYKSAAALATMHLGRIAALRGQFDEAFAQLAEARDAFAKIDSAGDVLEVDTRTAECRLLADDAQGALAVADDALARAAGLVERAALERTRGAALVALGRTEEGLAALESSLAEARARGARFDIALTLQALIEPYGRLGEIAAAEDAEREATAIFDELGVVSAMTSATPAPGVSGTRSSDLPTAPARR